MKKFRAYITYWFTGWKSVEVFGNPNTELGHYIVCLKNNGVMEGVTSIFHKPRWWHSKYGDFKDTNPVVYYREMPKPPRI
jgi:hypothetical protein